MLPTFVIGLREGLEAALIVGIIAAFLVQEGRRDAMRWVWVGVGLGVALALAVGIGLRVASEQLPQKEQEQLETVVALIAVGMVTWMIVWMRKHSAGLKGELRERTNAALAAGSTAALVGMAFLAVLREGFETAVFLVAVFNDASDPQAAGAGAVLGIAVAVVLGYLIYRGGVRIDLGRFFKFTGAVLVLVAAGLLSSALHTAHEAGWWNSMLGEAADLSAVVKPGSVQSALVTGMLGIQPKPTVGEVAIWFAYAIPMLWFVLHTPRPRAAKPASGSSVATKAGVATTLVVVLVVAIAVPAFAKGTKTIEIKLTDDGCPKKLTAGAGKTRFEVENVDASAVTEVEVLEGKRVVGEKENLTPGLSGEFTIALEPGRYTTLCPNGDRERGLLVVTGASTGGSSSAAGANATKVPVLLTEYSVTPTPTEVAAGNVTLVVRNAGGLDHELVAVRAAEPLPTEANGEADESGVPPADSLGEIEGLTPKSVTKFALGNLTPGTYQLFCNLVDKDGTTEVAHYGQGMHATLTVT